jgi:hypothetical protein
MREITFGWKLNCCKTLGASERPKSGGIQGVVAIGVSNLPGVP